MTSVKQPLILTTGEPAGIGMDLCIQLADYLATQPVVLCGDIEQLRERATLHGRSVTFHHQDSSALPRKTTNNSIAVHHIPLQAPVTPGTLNQANARYVIETLAFAAQATLDGQYSGIVTAPIHKGVICDAGGQYAHFSGHTEFFADATQAPLPVMVLATEQLKVALVTTHLPLSAVPAAITESRLTAVLEIIHRDMQRYFTTKPPRIGVCGLNPHAGESGHMGNEEITVINPTLQTLRQQGINVSEALPADTLFVPRHAEAYDIIVAMYHDQGLPVIKAQGFGECVNLTFGLPIVRTSVDHGTALDLAGTTQADSNSLKCAIETAKQMAGIA